MLYAGIITVQKSHSVATFVVSCYTSSF